MPDFRTATTATSDARRELFLFRFRRKNSIWKKPKICCARSAGFSAGFSADRSAGSLGNKFEEELRARGAKNSARAYLYCTEIEEEAAALLETFGAKCVAIDEIFAAAKLLGRAARRSGNVGKREKSAGIQAARQSAKKPPADCLYPQASCFLRRFFRRFRTTTARWG